MFLLNKERRSFLTHFLRNPRQMGSIIPSSPRLATTMVNAIREDSLGVIAELGAGTGAITRALAQRVHCDTKVVLFEKEPRLASELQAKFPDYHCYPAAEHMVDALHQNGIDQVDCIVSGLPFFNFSPAIRERLLEQITMSLKPGGQFIAFQYSLQMKPLLAKCFEIEDIRLVPLNLPPAFVYCCRKWTEQEEWN
ncbi:methyltransferase domain-containing protein [Paenibacillus sp. PR3]|uniref:Methyltransferase domain-containing protein n=1 Tax=Paenibacillus terricola TaxID=2763503 RepID=A0ABR8MVJ9_9BACL|nr:methyltransferase domain-containing protein [Paenibacillus terricola]MBD3919993.1 methyltransferase domain-containing protein [Paenibacillus terricola]